MCGLAGFWDSHSRSGAGLSALALDMARTLAHRGPDDEGVWVSETDGLALGHRRLSVIDLTETGHQPMRSSCGRFMLAFNGEIYNHRDLRNDLPCNWRGHSDTETLLAAFSAWGVERTLRATVGMFALALWDCHERQLVLARDRMGEKPLYYGLQRGVLLFGSELRAFHHHPAFESKINWGSVDAFLRHNYVPAPSSIYSGINKLPPGTWVCVRAAALRAGTLPAPQAYWSLTEASRAALNKPFRGSIADAATELDLVFSSAVRGQLLSDVPLGAFLSGGVDSSLVVSTMQRVGSSRTMSFSIAVDDPKLDESSQARAVARVLDTEHHELRVSAQDALQVVHELGRVWDEPFADSSQIPTLVLSRFARKYVTVALSGDGGDELFWGYNHYRYLPWLWRLRVLGSPVLSSCLRPVAKAVEWVTGDANRTPSRTLAVLAATDEADMIERYLGRSRMLTPALRRGFGSLVATGRDDIALMSALGDAEIYLPDDILVKVDRASMSTSLETRAPMLDHRVVEFALSLPLEHKVGPRYGKVLLRHLIAQRHPNLKLTRRKQGFSVPMARWLRDELRDWASDLLERANALEAVLNPLSVRKVWMEHQSGIDHSESLWGVLSMLQFLRNRPAAA